MLNMSPKQKSFEDVNRAGIDPGGKMHHHCPTPLPAKQRRPSETPATDGGLYHCNGQTENEEEECGAVGGMLNMSSNALKAL